MPTREEALEAQPPRRELVSLGGHLLGATRQIGGHFLMVAPSLVNNLQRTFQGKTFMFSGAEFTVKKAIRHHDKFMIVEVE